MAITGLRNQWQRRACGTRGEPSAGEALKKIAVRVRRQKATLCRRYLMGAVQSDKHRDGPYLREAPRPEAPRRPMAKSAWPLNGR